MKKIKINLEETPYRVIKFNPRIIQLKIGKKLKNLFFSKLKMFNEYISFGDDCFIVSEKIYSYGGTKSYLINKNDESKIKIDNIYIFEDGKTGPGLQGVFNWISEYWEHDFLFTTFIREDFKYIFEDYVEIDEDYKFQSRNKSIKSIGKNVKDGLISISDVMLHEK